MMRLMILVGSLAFASAAGAQTIAGPLANPGSAPVASSPGKAKAAGKNVTRTAGRRAAGRKHVRKAAAPVAPVAETGRAADEAPTSAADHRANSDAGDPVSFGMKWNGNNDTAEKTRVQNYDGAAEGTGAEVGLKLHF